MISHSSSLQPFWHQGAVLWKTVFPQTDWGEGGWFQDDSSAFHLLCTLFILLLHQLQLRSSGIRYQGLGTPVIQYIFLWFISFSIKSPKCIPINANNISFFFYVFFLSPIFLINKFSWLCCNYMKSFCVELGEKAMAPHSSILAWKIPWEELRRLQSMGSLRVGHDWAASLSLFSFMHWRRKWQPTPVFLPGESQRWGSLVGCCLWGRTESDTTEVT